MNTLTLIKRVLMVNSTLIATFFINISVVVYVRILGVNATDSLMLFFSLSPLILAMDYFQFMSLLLLLAIVFAINVVLYRNLKSEGDEPVMNLLVIEIVLSTSGGLVLIINVSYHLLNLQPIHGILYSIAALCGAVSFLGPTLTWVGIYLFFIVYYVVIYFTVSNELASLISLLFSITIAVIPNFLIIKKIRRCYH